MIFEIEYAQYGCNPPSKFGDLLRKSICHHVKNKPWYCISSRSKYGCPLKNVYEQQLYDRGWGAWEKNCVPDYCQVFWGFFSSPRSPKPLPPPLTHIHTSS